MTFWQPFTGHHFSFKPFRPCLPADFQRAGPGLFPLLTAMLRIETTDSAFVTLSGMGQKMPLGIGVFLLAYGAHSFCVVASLSAFFFGLVFPCSPSPLACGDTLGFFCRWWHNIFLAARKILCHYILLSTGEFLGFLFGSSGGSQKDIVPLHSSLYR